MTLDDFLLLKSPATKRAYKTAISDFEDYLDTAAHLCSQSDAVKYLADFKESHSDASTKHRYHLLRSYFEYLVNIDLIRKNPFKLIPTLLSLRTNHQVRPTKTVPPEKVKQVLSSIDTTTKDGTLLFAFMGTLFGGGLRRGEARAICSRNVILDDLTGNWYLDLTRTKSGERRLQPIPDWLGVALRKISKNVLPNQPIFPWSESTAYRLFKKTCLDNGVICAPHSFRAAFATMLKQNGAEDREVADLLRHKTTHMVQVYDHRFRESSKKTNPCLENFFQNFKKSA